MSAAHPGGRAGSVLTAVENTLAAVPFAIVAVIAFVNVLTRYFFNLSLAFTTELTVNLVVWTVMIGAVIGIREGAHLGFTALAERTRGRARQVHTVLVAGAVLVTLGVLFVQGLDMTLAQHHRGRATPSSGVPQWLFTLAVRVGATLGIVRTVQAARTALRTEGSASDRLTGVGR